MRIEAIDLYHISQMLVAPFVTSFGPQQQRDAIIVTVYADGLQGWGECVATNDPGYSYETVHTAWRILKDFLIPALLGRAGRAGADRTALPLRARHPLAKASLEQAVWDLAAQRRPLLRPEAGAPPPEGPRQRCQGRRQRRHQRL